MKKAVLYRMVTASHICPFGIKSKDLLKREGFSVEDNHLKSSEETQQFKAKYDVKTTPQAFIEEKRVGGFDDLMAYFGKKSMKQVGVTYQPVIATFVMTFLMAIAVYWARYKILTWIGVTELFISLSMCVLAIFKLRDLFSFTNQFITYDLIGQRYVPYAYFYPFAEGMAGVAMIAGIFTSFFGVLAFFIGLVGAISVVKAVYIDNRELKCACVGGNSNVPLGFISLTENIMMMVMAVWMLIK